VRHVPGGERHRQVGAAVVGVVKHDHCLASGGVPRDLDRVLHRLSTRVHEDGAFLVVAGGDPVERLAHVHVPLVGVDHEAGVGEAGELFAGAGHHPGVGVTHVGDGDTGTEVDEPVAVHVFNDAAAGPHHVDRQAAAYSLS